MFGTLYDLKPASGAFFALARTKTMPIPKGIHPEALELLIEDDWPWDVWLFGFRRASRSNESAEATIRVRPT
jgi:hypothetical protein